MQLDGDGDGAHASVCAAEEAALDAVLAQVPWAAVVCDGSGAVLRANAAAERALDENDAPLREAIERAVRGEAIDLAASVSPLSVPGHAPHYLVVAKSGDHRVRAAVEVARRPWGLTEREARVLTQVASGASNRDVAARLGLAVRTVELYVTALLRKAGAGSRSQLILALWNTYEAPPAAATAKAS